VTGVTPKPQKAMGQDTAPQIVITDIEQPYPGEI